MLSAPVHAELSKGLDMKQYNKGFTLLELLVTLTIISTVTLIGVPSFQGAIRGSRLTTAINELVTALNVARSEAIKRNRYVVVRKTGANWENGWQIFVDISRATATTVNIFDDDGDTNLCEAEEDCLLKVQESLPNAYTLRLKNGSPLVDFVSYMPNGMRYIPSGASTAAVDNSFYLCDTNSNTTPVSGTAKVLILNSLGRPRMAIDSNNNAIPEITSGTDISSCTP